MSTESLQADIALVYQENAKILAIFLEWRHKVMTRWFAVTAAVFVAAAWLHEQPALRPLMFVAFLLGAMFSAISALLDQRNVMILQECYRLGAEAEEKLGGAPGIFAFIGQTHSGGVTYTTVLRLSYWGTVSVFLLLAVISSLRF